MNTKKCKHCGEQIPRSAKKCRFCGNSLGTPTWVSVLLTIFAVMVAAILICLLAVIILCFILIFVCPLLLILLFIFAAIAEGRSSNYYTEKTQNYSIGETYKTANVEARFISVNKDYSVVLTDNTYEVIKYTLNIKNNSKTSNLSVTNSNFRCYADSMLVNKYLGTGEYASKTYSIGQDESIDINVYCKVPVDTKVAKLRYRGADFIKD